MNACIEKGVFSSAAAGAKNESLVTAHQAGAKKIYLWAYFLALY
jgi:hypothetical protein